MRKHAIVTPSKFSVVKRRIRQCLNDDSYEYYSDIDLTTHAWYIRSKDGHQNFKHRQGLVTSSGYLTFNANHFSMGSLVVVQI